MPVLAGRGAHFCLGVQVYVRVGEEVFRDDLEVDLGALAGVTAMLAGGKGLLGSA